MTLTTANFMNNETFDTESFVQSIKNTLHTPPDLISQSFTLSSTMKGSCVFIESLVNKEKIENFLRNSFDKKFVLSEHEDHLLESLIDRIPFSPVTSTSDFRSCINNLLEGKCLLLFPNCKKVVLVDVLQIVHRGVKEPQSELTVRGPQEAFTEPIHLNISLIRQRLQNANLRIEQVILGKNTQTKVMILSIQDIANEQVVKEFRKRVTSIQIDSVLDSSYIEESIQDKTFSPFPTLSNSERPDVAISHLLEGRIVIIVDGCPNVLIGPVTFFQFFSAPEDHFERADIASILRWLRIFSFLLAVFVPSLYISIISYHHELLPDPLLINIAAQREGVPFPAVIEALVMLIIFEVLREAGFRMPRIAGQAISIVGALVLGQAAVEAGLVSALMVIIVATTAISNFVSPSFNFGIAQRFLQIFYIVLGSFMGLFGILCGTLFTIVHLASIRSFGVPYLAPIAPLSISDWKDVLVRVPRPWMKKMPEMNETKQKNR
ncbi:spore germination protein [Shimazuella kribbensis]|uniref:spore germination protein n=1 Tax=Shimazuella kribbensis TaxID=139808 RepID=UPI000423A227|nr:spore germination protein [Shimazuella kribbensis]